MLRPGQQETAGHGPQSYQLPGAVHPSLSQPVAFPSQSPLLGPGHLRRTKHLTPWGPEADRVGPDPGLNGFFFYILITVRVLCLLLCDPGNCYFPFVFISNSIFRVVKLRMWALDPDTHERSNSGSPLRAEVILGK